MSSLIKTLVRFLQRVGRMGLEAAVSLIYWLAAGNIGASSPKSRTQGSRMPAKESRVPGAHRVGMSRQHFGRTLLTPPLAHGAVRMEKMCYAPSESLHMYNGGGVRLWLSPHLEAIMWLVPLTRVWCNPRILFPSQWTRLSKIKAPNNPRPHLHQGVSPSLPQSKFRDSAPSGKKYLRWEKVTNSPSPYTRLLMDFPIMSETCFAFLSRLAHHFSLNILQSALSSLRRGLTCLM